MSFDRLKIVDAIERVVGTKQRAPIDACEQQYIQNPNCFGEGEGREHLSKAIFNVLSVLKSTIRGFEKESTSFLIMLDIMWVLELHE